MNSARRGIRTVGLFVCSLWLGSALSAQNEGEIPRVYFQFGLGGTQVSETDATDLDLGLQLSGVVGYRLIAGETLDFSLEGEAAYVRSNFDDVEGDLEITGLFGNAVVDWRLYDKFGLYGGAGIGYFDADAGSDDAQEVGWQLKTGVRYKLGETLAMNLGYKYWSIEETDLSDSDAHTFEVGLTWGAYWPRIFR